MTAALVAGALHLALALADVSAVQGIAPPELELAWSAPDDCPDRAELTSRVNRLLGGVVKSRLTATTDVTRTAGVYRARLRVTTSAGSGERILESGQCDTLADSVALVIALSVSGGTDSSQNELAAPAERLALAVSAQGSWLFGGLPQPAAGVGGAIAIEGLVSLRFELRGAYYSRQSTTFAQSALGGRFGLVTFGARACRLWSLGTIDLAPCVGAESYFVSATGFGGTVSRHQEASFWGPAGGLFGRVRITKTFAVYVVADGVAGLPRRRFVFSDVGELYRSSAIALGLNAAVEVRF
ncbi:MAG TPA: hypothetical protein VH062_15440 [Polyangiaceae bacterium]|jgi:hypothetical protein|nr:hypothetical protein [Polyangiaceae bacterium]